MGKIALRGSYHLDRNAYIVGSEPAIFHCHHYNCFLQAVIRDTSDYLPGIDSMLMGHAQEIAYAQFTSHFNEENFSFEERKQIIQDYFRFAGFGVIDLSEITDQGGNVSTASDHYGIGWKSKFGISKEPVSFFTAGFLSGACEAALGLPLGTFSTKQNQCIAMGHDDSTFSIAPTTSRTTLASSQGTGSFQTNQLNQPDASVSGVDYGAVREALTNMPIEGSEDSGIIEAFGVLLTRHYANYYCNISNSLLHLFRKEMGDKGVNTAIKLLVEAGHVCAFNTFGGIMQSNEWNGMIKPMLKSNDDWIHGIVAVVNAFGWGFWEIEEFVPNEKLRLKITSGYEANSFLGKYEKSDIPISFLATGGVAGLMNLIYVLNLPNTAPITLDEALYKKIHMSDGFFEANQLQCRGMGAEYDVIEATKRR